MSVEKQNHQNGSGKEKALELLLGELMAKLDKDIAEAIGLCAIPHRFNEKILAVLRKETAPSVRTRKILNYLTGLVFVVPKGKGSWIYHNLIRNLLIKRWRQEDKQRFRELNLKLAAHYADQEEEKQELIYHLLAGEVPQGFELFKKEISDANEHFRYSTTEALLKLFKEPGISPTKEQNLYLRYYEGELCAISGQWNIAQKILIPLNAKKLPQPLKANVLARLGTVNNRLGDWSQAVKFYKRSLKIAREMTPRRRAWTHTGLGLIYKWQGKFKQAKTCHEAAAKIAKNSQDLLWRSRALNNLGEICQLLGELEQARQYYNQSIKFKKQLGDTYGLIWSYINLGSLFIDLEKWDEASEFLLDGLKMARDIESPPEEAWALEYLGELYRRQQNIDKAWQHLVKGLFISEKSGNKYRTASIQIKLGALYEEQGKDQLAVDYLRKGYQALKQLKSYEVRKVKQEIKRLDKRIKR